MYLGDFKEDGDIFFKFTTRKFGTGATFLLAGSPVLSVYVDEGTSPKTTAEAYFDLDVDFNSKTGLNNVRIDLSGDDIDGNAIAFSVDASALPANNDAAITDNGDGTGTFAWTPGSWPETRSRSDRSPGHRSETRVSRQWRQPTRRRSPNRRGCS